MWRTRQFVKHSFLALAVVVAGCSPEKRAWEEASQKHDSKAFEAYLTQYPDGAHRDDAKRGLDAASWEEAQAAGTVEALRRYLTLNPVGSHTQQAREQIDRLERVHVPEELKSALDALVPESRFAFFRLRTSGPEPGKPLQPSLRLVVCGTGLFNNDDEKLSRATLKSLGKPLFTSSHAYVRSPATLSGEVKATSETILPGGAKFLHEEIYLPGSTTPDSLWARCVADLKANLPGVVVSSRTDGSPKDPDLIEVKFCVAGVPAGT